MIESIGRIDVPISGENVVADFVLVEGWVTWDGAAAEGAVILLDGIPVHATLTDRTRPDVAASFGLSEDEKFGFSCIVDLNGVNAEGLVRARRSHDAGVKSDERALLSREATLTLLSVGPDGAMSEVLANVSIHIAPASPLPEVHGWVEFPEQGALIPLGITRVSGWAMWGEKRAPLVLIEVNGQAAGQGEAKSPRPDVVDLLGGATPEDVGFDMAVDLAALGLSEGDEVEIVVSVLGDLGSAPTFVDPATLRIGSVIGRVGPPSKSQGFRDGVRRRSRPEGHGGVELPEQGALIPLGITRVSGWAMWGEKRAPLVLIEVNGQAAGQGEAKSPRPDVVDLLGGATPEDVGFDMAVDLAALGLSEGDEVEIVVSVLGDLGSAPTFVDPATLRIGSVIGQVGPLDESLGFRGSLDHPHEGDDVRRGPLNLMGWALCPGGLPASVIEVLVEGTSAGFARLGLPREDIAGSDSRYTAISGYELLLDLSDIPESEEVKLSVVAYSIDGKRAIIAERVHRIARGDEKSDDHSSNSKLTDEERRVELLSRRTQVASMLKDVTRAPSPGLNLLAVTHDLGYGGGQLWLSEFLARSGAGRDFPCTVLAMRGGPLRRDLEELGISVHVTSSVPVDDIDGYEGRLTELVLLVRKTGVNAVLANTFSAFAGADLAVRMELPCIWAIHESYPPSLYWDVAYPPNHVDVLVRERIEEVLGMVDFVVFEAEATRQQYLKTVPDDRAIVVRYGVDNAAIEAYTKKFSKREARRNVGLPASARVLLVMGTTEPRKSQTFLAEAFAEIASDHADARLVFVGDTGTRYAKALRTFVFKSGLSDQVTIAPVTRDIFTWYRSADVLVSASDIESLPRSILEAMSFGLPVAAASVFGIPELITDANTGFLFAPRDLNATVEVLRRVLEVSSEGLNAVARSARELASESYDSSGYASELTTLLRDLVSRSK